MSRVPLDLAAEVCEVKPATLRRWVREGHVTEFWNGLDYDELIAYRDGRNLQCLAARAGVKHPETVGVSFVGPQTRV